jgi:hypothetical protein
MGLPVRMVSIAWVPAFAGMTACFSVGCEAWIAAFARMTAVFPTA